MNGTKDSAAPLPGWYGKLPGLGDFASRRLPEDFVHEWDDWLQHGLAALRAPSPAGGGDIRMYRYWFGPSVLGGGAGVLAPSADRSGRRFPLTILAATPTAPRLADALAARQWYAAIEGIVRQTMDQRSSLDEFEDALAAAVADLQWPARTDTTAEALAARLLRNPNLAGAAEASCSVWWRGDARNDAAFHCCTSLPGGENFAVLFGAESS